MVTFVAESEGNYGTIVQIVNAEDEEAAREILKNHPHCWDGYTLETVDTKTGGVVYDTGQH